MSRGLIFELPTPLDYFASLVASDESFSLLEAAIAVAQDEHPQLDAQGVLAEVDRMAAQLVRRIPADAAALQRLRSLNRFFFHELGFGGNLNDYYDPDNSYLHRVIETRRGSPITLALLYVEIATQIGLSARGVSFPGHYLVKVHTAQGEVVIDPFSGQSLSRDVLDERLAPFRRQRGLEGDFDMPLGLFLQAATPRETLARLLRNLKEIHGGAREWLRLARVLDRLVVLLPDDAPLRRDRAQCRAELGRYREASEDMARYLEQQPQAADAAALRGRLSLWRTLGRPRLH